MFRKRLSKIRNRAQNGLFAVLFVATQIVFPLSFAANASAAGGSPAADLDQCRNGTLTSPAQCIDSGGSVGWVNGNAGASDSHWREGDSIAYRMLFSNLSLSSHTVTIQWDTTKSGKHAIDYLTTYNRTETTALPCSNVAGCGSPTTFAIPDDPNSSVAQVPGVFTLFNGTITSVSAYSLTGSYAGDSSTAITITFNASNATPVLAWGGHIASQIDWGFGNSASAINGSPYHTRLLDLDGSGGNQDRSLAAAAVFPTPVISTQVSSASVVVGGTVTDTATLSGPNSPLDGTVNFFVCGPSATNPDCTTGGTQVGSSVAVSPGTGKSGTATSASYMPTSSGDYCFRAEYTPGADSPYSPQNHTNLTTECFTASIPPSTITIIKDAQPDSSQAFGYTTTGLSTDQTGFSLVDSGSGNTNSRTFTNLGPGVYTVSEQAVSGWDFKNINCGAANNVSISGSTVTITITGGQSVACTYTNAERGTVTVHKVTNPANDPTGFSITAHTGNGNIAGNVDRTVSTSSDVTYDVSQGTYSVSEDLANTPGWTQTDNTCSNLVVSADNLHASCTITNTKLAKLKIVKSTNPGSSSQAFSFSATGPSVNQGNSSFVLDTNGNDNTYPSSNQYTNLTPGAYTVTETEPSNWRLTNLVCNGITYAWPGNTQTLSLNLPAGADVTCTFTNTQLTSITGTKFEVNADQSTVGTVPNWTIYLLVNGQVVDQTTTDANGNYSFTGLLPGSYTLAEGLPGGWTQIYWPGSVDLSAGSDSTGNNFGNFKNAEISGSKFNDKNGNHQWDAGEPGLSGWTITLYDNGGSGSLLNHQVAQTSTAADGSYSFTNLPPTTYKLCETMQTNWVQTFPTDNGGCWIVTVALSGHDYTHTDFGNRGRGTIAVVKNVDTDGDGQPNFTDVTNWNWNIDGSGNYTTGSGNEQGVFAGDYTVSEVQKDGYHVTASSCTGEDSKTVSTSKSVTVSPGENVVCTFTNTRDTGTVTVNKVIVPSTDSGLFNLNINGPTSYTASDQGNGGSTGAVSVVTGSYNVSESAGSDTSMSDYSSYYSCDNGLHGSATTSDSFNVASGENVSCTFTNTRLATFNVVKDAVPNDLQDFNFHFGSSLPVITGIDQILNANQTPNVSDTTFTLDDDAGVVGADNIHSNTKQFDHLLPGTYYVNEDAVAGWDLTNVSCGDGVSFSRDGSNVVITIAPGANITCTFTNTKRGSLTIVKDAQPDSSQSFNFTGSGFGEADNNFSLVDDGSDSGTNQQSFTNLQPGNYSVTESSLKGWNLDNIDCVGGSESTGIEQTAYVDLQPGENVVCTFTNVAIPPRLTVIKHVDNENGNDKVASDFTMHVDGTASPLDSSFPGDEQGTTVTMNTGAYSATEDELPGYTATYSEGCSGTLELGDEAVCTVTNTSNPPVVNLVKTNNKPNPTVDGDTVTYTLVVTVPEDSGEIFNANLSDLPPDNFTYVSGSWTANSSDRGDLKAADVTSEPTYGSPGVWHLGNLLPGEVVTLTYKAIIGSNVSDGTYPDLAFVSGSSAPVDGSQVLGNLSFASTPFVGTQVSVVSTVPPATFSAGQVLGAETLVNTGTNLLLAEFVLPVILIGGVVIVRRSAHQGKGSK